MSIPVFKISQCEKKEKGIDIRSDLAYNKGAKSERRKATGGRTATDFKTAALKKKKMSRQGG